MVFPTCSCVFSLFWLSITISLILSLLEMEVKGEEDGSLVEERKAKMVSLANPKASIKRKAWFLKPIASTISDLLEAPLTPPPHYKGTTFSSKETPIVSLEGWVNPHPLWAKWVSKLQPSHGDSWRKAGIFDAIQASTYKIRKTPSLVLGVALFWCRETNTFLFPWGEATLTLEDVMVLGCYSVLGEPVPGGSLPGELAEIEAQMVEEKRKFNKASCKKAHHSVWMKHYLSEGNGGELEHIAFLSLWLSRYVLSVHPVDTVKRNVFPIAIKLARGTRIALAPAVLANLYHDLGLIKDHLLVNGGINGPPLVVWANFKLLHLWVWERFVTLSPDSPKFVDSDAPRAARWNEINFGNSEISHVRTVIERHGEFQWRPYATSLDNWCMPSCYVDEGKWFTDSVDEDDDLRSFARCLRVCELVGMDCTEKYFPNRVARQFGFDQDIPMHVVDENSATEVAEKAKFYVSPRCFQPEVTHLYVKFWKKLMVLFRELNAGKKRKRRMVCVFNGQKQRVGDSYDTKLSDWLFLKNRISSKKIKPLNIKDKGLCLTVEMRRAKKFFLKKKQLSISFLYDSKNLSDDRKQIEYAKLNSETKEERKGSRELSLSELSEIDDKMNMNGESTYSQAAMEELEAAFESQQAKIRSENSTRKELEREMQIKKLKEEIAVIQTKVMELESLRDGKPNSVLP